MRGCEAVMVDMSDSTGFSFELVLWLSALHPTIASARTIAAAITMTNGFLLAVVDALASYARMVD